MLAVRFSLQESGSGWTLYEQDAPHLTPMGQPVATAHRPLAERLLEGVRAQNEQDTPTPYSLQVWYLDFGRKVPVEHLRAAARELLPRPLPEPRLRPPGGRRGPRPVAQRPQLRGARDAGGRPVLRDRSRRIGAPQRARPPGGP